jgi:hypothetical protein
MAHEPARHWQRSPRVAVEGRQVVDLSHQIGQDADNRVVIQTDAGEALLNFPASTFRR